MKVLICSLVLAVACNGDKLVSITENQTEPPKPIEVAEQPIATNQSEDVKQLSYIKGLEFGKALKLQGFDKKPLDIAMVVKGVEDYLNGQKLHYSDKQLAKILANIRENLQVEGAAIVQELEGKNKERIDALLRGIKDNKDIKTTKTGLKYQVFETGTGKEQVNKTSIVDLNIRSLLESGKVFYATFYGTDPDFLDMPLTTAVAKIPLEVFQEVIVEMKAGDRWFVHIPSERAYGKEGARGAVPPNSNIILDVKLLSVNNP